MDTQTYFDFVVDLLQHGDVDGRLAETLHFQMILFEVGETDLESISVHDFRRKNPVETYFENVAGSRRRK